MELLVRACRGPAPIREVADRQSAAGQRALFLNWNQVQGATRNLASKSAGELGEARFEQQPARRRGRPGELRDLLAVVPDVARLGCERAEEAGADAAERDPVIASIAALFRTF